MPIPVMCSNYGQETPERTRTNSSATCVAEGHVSSAAHWCGVIVKRGLQFGI